MNDARNAAKTALTSLENIPPWEWPHDTGEVLLGILGNDAVGEEDRVIAAEFAGNSVVINDTLADALLSVLCDGRSPARLRAQAAISFGAALEHSDIDGFEDPDDAPISEAMFRKVKDTLRGLYDDTDAPKEVRRRSLEAAVRAGESWHQDAVRAAYASEDQDWKLTAVFCMRYVRGFDEEILESLDAGNGELRYEAVCAAGNREVKGAWPHIAGIITSERADKSLLLAAIEAAVGVCPERAPEVLGELMNSEDEDIAAAAFEAAAIAEGLDEMEEDDFY